MEAGEVAEGGRNNVNDKSHSKVGHIRSGSPAVKHISSS